MVLNIMKLIQNTTEPSICNNAQNQTTLSNGAYEATIKDFEMSELPYSDTLLVVVMGKGS
jgi:hypothetical protein